MRPVETLQLEIHASTGGELVGYLRKHLRSAWELLSPPLRHLSVALVGDARMSRLHKEFMNISGPTDVLTFPLDEPDRRGRSKAGEVVICVPEARRRSKSTGVPLRDEVLLYGVHGMLHLCGFDDRTEQAYKTMHRMEDDILERIGVGRVFEQGRDPATRRHKRSTATTRGARRR